MSLCGEKQRYATIRKNLSLMNRRPNMIDYVKVMATFDWNGARSLLEGLPDGKGMNIAHEAVDRHARGAAGEHVAILWIGRSGERREITYRVLRDETNRFANVLRSLGLGRGDRVFTLLGRVPELYVAVLGSLKANCVASPLFSAFGPEPIATRLELGEGVALVTTEALYKRKIEPLRGRLPKLTRILLVDAPGDGITTLSLQRLLEELSPEFNIPATEPEDMALLHFTSGTTGRPKGAIHVHDAIVTHFITGLYALDLHPQDRFWCTADPGWVTRSYGILAPLAHGVTNIVVEAEFRCAHVVRRSGEKGRVTVWYTAPTAIRMMMKLGREALQELDLLALRFMASVGEPLNPEAVVWRVEAFGRPFHDNWWQTETGGIMIANYAAMDVKPGSMGRPLPGIEAAVVRRTPDGSVEIVDRPDEQGELALKAGWPSMMRGYLHEDERFAKCFANGWYLTGDLASRDEDGYFWFVGRADDVIKSAGHLIGPFEVESTLMEHPAVAEAGVIGKPDPIVGEIVKAFVALKPGFEATDVLRKELLGHARKRLGAAVAPKEIEFKTALPRTRSGKIMRRLLKARELGLPEGDLSTLESDEK